MTNIAKVNAAVNEIEELKSERRRNTDLIGMKTEKLIKMIELNKTYLVYKNDEPHLLQAQEKTTEKFNRNQMAEDLDVNPGDLNIPGVVDLVEDGKIDIQQANSYWYEEMNVKLSLKKATKKQEDDYRASDHN